MKPVNLSVFSFITPTPLILPFILIKLLFVFDIIFLFLMIPRIGRLAVEKGLDSRKWRIRTILIWFGAEIVGWLIAAKIYGLDVEIANGNMSALIGSKKMMMVNLIALGFAVASYFTVKNMLENKEDVKSKPYDINRHVED